MACQGRRAKTLHEPNLLAARLGAALWSDMRPLGRVVAMAVLAFSYPALLSVR
jgi:hypothetical protein